MTPVMQTILKAPGGNCFQACVASLLDLPLEDVPHFFEGSKGGPITDDQWNAIQLFAKKHNHQAIWVDPDTETHLVKLLFDSGFYYCAIGPSPATKLGHCVVQRTGSNIHDPSSGLFLAGDPWLYIAFEPCKGEL